MIMTLGVIVFDTKNTQCTTAHPSSSEQYNFEWAFANLDLNGDGFLDQTEMSVLKNAVPEITEEVPTAGSSLDFFSFVHLLRLSEAL